MSSPGADLERMRKRVDKTCDHCGATMRGVLKKRVYCCITCRNRAKRERREKSAPASVDKDSAP